MINNLIHTETADTKTGSVADKNQASKTGSAADGNEAVSKSNEKADKAPLNGLHQKVCTIHTRFIYRY